MRLQQDSSRRHPRHARTPASTMDDDDAGEELMPGVWFKVEAPGRDRLRNTSRSSSAASPAASRAPTIFSRKCATRRVRVGDGDVPPALSSR